VNFGPKLEPFGISVSFEADKVSIAERELEAAELAEEGTLNAKDRVLMALAEGPTFLADIAEATRLELGTVKNALTALRKLGKVESTGTKDHRGSNEVRLVSSPSLSSSDSDSDACEQAQGGREDDDKGNVCACGGSGCIECLTQELPLGDA
jgi:DNA-binding transcriptional ArsR family regulator